jgi:hypothetical protein
MAMLTHPHYRGKRGAILIVALVFVSILLSICFSFATTLRATSRTMEDATASVRALELAQAANLQNLARIWADYKQKGNGPIPDNYDGGTAHINDPGGAITAPPDRLTWLWSWYSQPKFNQTTYIYYGQGEAIFKVYQVAKAADNSYADFEFKATARVSPDRQSRVDASESERQTWPHRTISMTARFNFVQPSRVYDFAYFANNFGWMYDNGSGAIKIFGGLGANGDVEFRGHPWMNGDVFAALNPSLPANGNILGANVVVKQNLSQYRTYVNGLPSEQKQRMPPTNPAYTEDVNGNGFLDSGEDSNHNGQIDSTGYLPGYNGSPTNYTKQTPLDMPYLGDLSTYKEKALAEHGNIKQLKAGGLAGNEADWETVVDAVYGDEDGEDGLYTTVDGSGNVTGRVSIPAEHKLEPSHAKRERNGNVALVGTDARPLKITGPVVVTNDLVIKGKITGQGTLYTGRNLHLVGDVTYVNPPTWTQNDSNFSATLAANNQKDMVGFATKGSVILGQYYRISRTGKTAGSGRYDDSDGWNTARYYFQTGFQNAAVQGYQTDPTDQSIGYYDPATKRFSGNYLSADGGNRYDSASDFTQRIARNYYESSFSDEYVQSIATSKPSKVHGIFYTNHLFGGRPSDLEILGSMVCRDEGIVFNGHAYFFYDPRASSATTGSRVRVFLPATVGRCVWLWKESATPVDSKY